MLTRKPEVSVLTTVYNGLRYIRETVESVLAQTLKDFEYVIVDDGSTDGTREYLRSLGDPRIRTICLPRSGRGFALNAGLAACRADFVAIIDADDVNTPARLEIQLSYMKKHPEIDVLACICSLSPERLDTKVDSDASVIRVDKRDFMRRTVLSHSGVMMRLHAVLNVGGYNETRKSLFDYDLWFRLAHNGYTFGKIPACLVYKRIHGGQYYESRNRIQYLASGFKGRLKAARLFSKNPLNYFYPVAGFLYGLLPMSIRRRDN